MKDKKIKSRDGNTNVVADEVVIKNGISYSEAKEIAQDVFDNNIIKFTEEAQGVVIDRSQEFASKLVDELKKIGKPEIIENFRDPGFQFDVFEAQKSYALNGDMESAELLIDLLIKKIDSENRSLKQIVLSECIKTIPKLTPIQLDILSLILIVSHTQFFSIGNHDLLKDFLENKVNLFLESLNNSKDIYLEAEFRHLEFLGCISTSIGSKDLVSIFLRQYKGLFLKGFDLGDVKEKMKDSLPIIQDMLISCLNDTKKVQLNALNEAHLQGILSQKNASPEDISRAVNLFNSGEMNSEEVKEVLINLSNSMEKLFDFWDGGLIKNSTLSTVGVALGATNYSHKTGENMDLGIWIK